MKKLLLTIASALLATSAFAYDGESFEYDGLSYAVLSEDDHTAEIFVNYSSNLQGHVIIPSTVTYNSTEYTVTQIFRDAFMNCQNITSVAIPSTMTKIGSRAFYRTGLTSIAIPESVTEIGEKAFYWTPMVSVTIPTSVESIGAAAFASYAIEEINVVDGNSHFKSVNGVLYDAELQTIVQYPCAKATFELPETVTAIGDYAFCGCEFPDLIISCPIETIGCYAFNFCDTRSIILPETVTSIGDDAFNLCNKSEYIYIPSSVMSIGERVFAHCTKLMDLDISEDNKYFKCQDGVLYDYEMTTLIECLPSSKTIHIPPTVKIIADWAFYTCYDIADVELPEGLTKIGNYAFYCATNLISISIPESTTEIGDRAFAHCENLILANLPSKLKAIGQYTFSHCNNLRRIVIPESVSYVGERAFSDCYNLQTIVFPRSVRSLDRSAFNSCTKLKTVVFSDTLSDISLNTFADVSNLNRVIALNPTPPIMSNESFSVEPDDVIVYYPPGDNASATLEAYKNSFSIFGISDFRLLGDFYAILDLYDLQIEAGNTDKLNAYIGQLGTATVATESWESSNPEVATVDDNGNVTAVKPGTAIVTYTMTDSNYATYSDSCTVTVDGVSVVDEIDADTFDSDAPADVYTLSGILVKNGATSADINALPAGLYILRQGPTAKKIAVK